MLFLGTVDKKKITGRQGRGVHKTSHIYKTCYFPDYGQNLKVEVDVTTSNQINLLTGCGLIDGTVVEETEVSSFTINDAGDYRAYIEVDLTDDLNPVVSFGAKTGSLIQDDLTVNKNGVHQGELATFSFVGSSIVNLKQTIKSGDVSENVDELIEQNKKILNLSELGINDGDFSGLLFDECFKLIANAKNYPIILKDNVSTGNYPNLTNAIGNKHQGESSYSINYSIMSSSNPSELTILVNQSNISYDYTTDNYVATVTKYGDFCRENMKTNHFTAINTGNYIQKLKETTEKLKIGFLGDSLTRGYDTENGSNVTYFDDNGDSKTTVAVRTFADALMNDYLLKAYPGRFEYNNMGWSGGTVVDLYNRYWKNRNFDAVLIMIGTNDDSYNLTPSEYEKYYSALIQRLLYTGAIPIIVGSVSRRIKTYDTINIYRTIAKKLAEKYNLYYIDGGVVSQNMDFSMYSDSTHFNVDGYAYLGRVFSVPFFEDAISEKQKVRSGSGILFNSSNNIFVTESNLAYRTNYPTPDVSENGAPGLVLAPGHTVYIPFLSEEKGLYIFPQIYVNTENQELEVTISNINQTPQAENSYYEEGPNLEAPIARYGKWRTFLDINDNNFRANTIFNLIGAIESETPTNKLVNCTQLGEQLLTLKCTGTQAVTIHLVEFLSEKDYLLATRLSGSRFFKDGSSKNPAIFIN